MTKDISRIEDLRDACELAWSCWGSDGAEWGVWTGWTDGAGWVGGRADAGGRADVGGNEGSRGGGGGALGLLLAHFFLIRENTSTKSIGCVKLNWIDITCVHVWTMQGINSKDPWSGLLKA